MKLTEAFAEMMDPRHPDMIQYPLVEVIAIALCALLVGADDWWKWRRLGKQKTFCIYDAPSPEAIRQAANRNNLPVDSISEVRVLDPYFYK